MSQHPEVTFSIGNVLTMFGMLSSIMMVGAGWLYNRISKDIDRVETDCDKLAVKIDASCKRLAEKLAEEDEKLQKQIDDADLLSRSEHKAIYDHIEKRDTEGYHRDGEIERKLDVAREERDRQMQELSERITRIETAHKMNHGSLP